MPATRRNWWRNPQSREESRRSRGGPGRACLRHDRRGPRHDVTLFDAAAEIGGQFNLAKRIPGKEEFAETLRYYGSQLKRTGVRVELNKRVGASDSSLRRGAARHRHRPAEAGDPRHRSSQSASYVDIVEGRKAAGRRVAIIGAGGIGFDVAELLSMAATRASMRSATSGASTRHSRPAALKAPHDGAAPREIYCCRGKPRRSARASPRPPAGFAARCSRSAA